MLKEKKGKPKFYIPWKCPLKIRVNYSHFSTDKSWEELLLTDVHCKTEAHVSGKKWRITKKDKYTGEDKGLF